MASTRAPTWSQGIEVISTTPCCNICTKLIIATAALRGLPRRWHQPLQEHESSSSEQPPQMLFSLVWSRRSSCPLPQTWIDRDNLKRKWLAYKFYRKGLWSTDQLVLRKNMPKNIATKPPRMLSLANCTATTRRGMLGKKETIASKINKKKRVCKTIG